MAETKPTAETTPRTDNKAYTPFEDDANPQVVNADFARSLERSLARKEALLRTIRDKCRLSSTHHIHVSDEELAEIERS